MKDLISSVTLSYICCLPIIVTSEVKLSQEEAMEFELSASVIPVYESKGEVFGTQKCYVRTYSTL